MNDDFGLLNDKEQAFVDAYTEKVRKQERERIIELLEDRLECEYSEPDWMGNRVHFDWCSNCALIAEIKGENE